MSSRVFIFTFSTRITFLPSARQGNVFTDVCDSIYRGVSPQQTATAADGTHPTGMHSCKVNNFKFKGFQNCSGFTVIIFNFVPASHFFSPEILRQFPLVQQQSFHRQRLHRTVELVSYDLTYKHPASHSTGTIFYLARV